MKPLTLRQKLTLFYTSFLALIVGSAGYADYRVLAGQLDAATTEELVELSAGLRGYMQINGAQLVFTHDTNDPEEVFFVERAQRLFQLYAVSTGQLVAQSQEMGAIGLPFPYEELDVWPITPTITDVQTLYGRIRIVDAVLVSEGGTYLLRCGISMSNADQALANFLRVRLSVLPVLLLIAGCGSWWIVGRSLVRLRRTAQAAETIGAADLDRRLPVRGSGDELDQVVEAFNRTLTRLESAVKGMRQFTGSIAHELKTPLTILRGEADVALMRNRTGEEYRDVLVSQIEEYDRLTRMIDRTLVLARAESGEVQFARNPVAFSELLEQVCGDMEPVAAAKNITVETNLERAVGVIGDSDYLKQMLFNVLDNAVKFTPEDGHVRVELIAEEETAVLRVGDTGCGIPSDSLPYIFDRFYRADSARSSQAGGVGLGLALVHWIVLQHGGAIQVASELGAGATFTLRLPASGRTAGNTDES